MQVVDGGGGGIKYDIEVTFPAARSGVTVALQSSKILGIDMGRVVEKLSPNTVVFLRRKTFNGEKLVPETILGIVESFTVEKRRIARVVMLLVGPKRRCLLPLARAQSCHSDPRV